MYGVQKSIGWEATGSTHAGVCLWWLETRRAWTRNAFLLRIKPDSEQIEEKVNSGRFWAVGTHVFQDWVSVFPGGWWEGWDTPNKLTQSLHDKCPRGRGRQDGEQLFWFMFTENRSCWKAWEPASAFSWDALPDLRARRGQLHPSTQSSCPPPGPEVLRDCTEWELSHPAPKQPFLLT